MDMRDLFYIGSNILDEVTDAVITGDYSGLSESLREMNEEMQKSAARVRAEQEEYRRQYQEQMRKRQEEYAKYRMTGAGAQAAGQQQYHYTAPKPASARGPVRTPFMQQPISRYSGAGRMVGGTLLMIPSIILFFSFLIAGIANPGGFLVAAGVFAAVSAYLAWQIRNGKKRKNRVDLYYKYGGLLGNKEFFKFRDLAEKSGRSTEQVKRDIKDMMADDMLPQAKIDAADSTVMLTPQVYRNYLDAEKGRLEREERERREKEALRKSGYSEEVEAILKEGENYLAMVRQANAQIPGDEMTDKLLKLENIMDRIFTQVKKEPKSAQNLRRFMNYYLPTTQKLLDAYVELDKQQEDVANVTNTKREIESAMDTINEAFENLLDSLFEEVAWDVSSDISAMRTMMAQDGLTPDEIAQASAKEAAAAAKGAASAVKEAAPLAKEAVQETAEEKTQAVVEGQGMTLTFGGGAQAQMAPEEKESF
ncbi:MAG: 5-bromo-4-chloroindolyl phosphate hydrolysis family protein [Eubacterium sp.]|nr:5-bromo-4-chloroindolyl phosphate hydrolysis family protein [Eubacterium sp.]MBQ9023299.1 5-bromo-4-chloroindolyl phosphate hydrolysis family protein [Eubacterium sp.]